MLSINHPDQQLINLSDAFHPIKIHCRCVKLHENFHRIVQPLSVPPTADPKI